MGANPSRERAHLNSEYYERVAADQSLASGNTQAAALHQNRADWAAYQADQVHYKRYQKGRTFAPYAVHPGPTPYGVGAGALPTAPTYSTMPYTHMGSGAIYPGYSGPTMYNPVGSMIESYPVTTQVPVGAQTYDLCVPTTTLAPVGAIAAPVGYGYPAATVADFGGYSSATVANYGGYPATAGFIGAPAYGGAAYSGATYSGVPAYGGAAAYGGGFGGVYPAGMF